MKVASIEPGAYPRRGILLMITAVSLFAFQDACAKYLVERYPVLMVIWARFFFNVLFMLIALAPIYGRRLIATKRPWLQMWRGVALVSSSILFTMSLQFMRLADASAVSFVAPMLVTIGAVFVFGHKAPPGTWWALAASFTGVMLVVQPGSSTFTPAALLPLGTAVCAAAYQLMTSRLAGVDDGKVSLFIGALVSVAIATIPTLFVIVWPRSLFDGLIFLALGFLGAVSHYVLIRAFESAPPATLAPFSYLQICAALTLGWLVWGNFPGPLALAGMGLIVATGVVMALRQRVVSRR